MANNQSPPKEAQVAIGSPSPVDMPAPVSLIHFDTAKRELALASSIDEVKNIRDQAEAIRQYIKQQKGSFEMQNQAAEIKLRAERRAGEMLRESPDIYRGGNSKSHDVTLKDLDITAI